MPVPLEGWEIAKREAEAIEAAPKAFTLDEHQRRMLLDLLYAEIRRLEAEEKERFDRLRRRGAKFFMKIGRADELRRIADIIEGIGR